MNNMIANPEKFQAIKIEKREKNPTEINIDGKKISSESSVLLLGLEIDIELNFNKRIYKICNKSASEQNALNRWNRSLGFEKKKTLKNSFIYGNFNYCSIVWHFCSKNSPNKIENNQKKGFKISFKLL